MAHIVTDNPVRARLDGGPDESETGQVTSDDVGTERLDIVDTDHTDSVDTDHTDTVGGRSVSVR